MTRPCITVDELAAYLGVHRGTVVRWCREGRIPHVRIGAAIRFTPEQVDELVAVYTRKPVEAVVDVGVRNPRFRPRHKVVVMPIRRSGT